MSLEAICWVLNLAPVPRPWRHVESRAGRTRQLRAPTGKGAFPSVQATWVRYTVLSEHTPHTTLDRLEAAGIICPRGPCSCRKPHPCWWEPMHG